MCNENGILSERFQLQYTEVYMYSPATSDEVLSLLEKRVFMSRRNISFPSEAEVRKEHVGWSMENLIWTQRPDRSGANEVGFPDGRGDWMVERCEFAPILSTSSTHEIRTYARTGRGDEENIEKEIRGYSNWI